MDHQSSPNRPPTRAETMPVDRDAKPRQVRQHSSCAECRRLKLKCSRSWPCTSCIKRHCEQICPYGQAKTIKGKRMVFADHEPLHERIRQLEVALSQERAKTSSDPHPLLVETEWFTTEAGAGPSRGGAKSDEAGMDASAGAFGTLKIGTEGEAHFIGSFAGSEYLREESADSAPSTPSEGMRGGPGGYFDSGAMRVPQRAAYAETSLRLHDAFLAGGVGVAGAATAASYDIDSLRAELPDLETEGNALLAAYFDNVNWMYQPVSRRMFERDYLAVVYDGSGVRPAAHKLACVFLVMAVGVMFDLQREPWHERASQLFFYGRACLGLVGLEHASPATVLALHLMGTYIMNDKIGNSADVVWPILGAATKVAQSLGLHRDGTTFGLSPYETQERRMLYWEILTYDRLQSLCFGRPSAISNRASDTLLPDDESLLDDADGFHRSKYRLMEMMERVIDIQTAAQPTPYGTIQALERDLRQFREGLPESLLPKTPIIDMPLDRLLAPQTIIHRLSIRFMIAQTRLLLNRHWFACALKDSPEDPERSPFGDAFIAVYESAVELVAIVKQLVRYHPSLIARWWFFWFHALSASVCLAAVTIRAPLSAWAIPSYQKLQHMVEISAATRDGCRAKNGLAAIIQLSVSAQQAIQAASKTRRRASLPLATEDAATVSYLDHLRSGPKLVRVGGTPVSSPHDGATSSPTPTPPLDPTPPIDLSPDLSSVNGRGSERYDSRPATAATNAAYINPSAMAMPPTAVDFSSNQWLNSLVWQPQLHTGASGADGNVQLGNMGQLDVDMDTSIALGIGPSGQYDPLDVLMHSGGPRFPPQ